MQGRRSLSRREFLQTTFTASVAVAGSMSARAAGNLWKMRLATSSVMFSDLTIEQACERVARLGLEAIDVWCPFGPCKHLDDVDKRLGADGLKEVLARNKLKLAAFSVYAGGGLPRYAELIRKFGGGIAVRGSQGGKYRPEEITPKMREFFEKLKPSIEQAIQCNARLAIENHGNALLDSVDSFKAFVDLNPDPKRVGIAMAPYHLEAGKFSVEEAILVSGSQLLFFYAWQHGKDSVQLPGHGPTDCTPWLKALAKINFPHHVTIFMHGHPPADEMETAVAKSRDYLKECYAKL